MKKVKVYWKEHELDKVAAEMVRRGWTPETMRDRGGVVAVAAAQKSVLPEDRWKSIHARKSIEDVVARMRAPRVTISPAAPEPVVAAAPEPVVAAAEPHAFDALVERVADLFVSAVVASVNARLAGALTDGVSLEDLSRRINAPEAGAEKKARLPRVVILGPWPGLFAQVKNEFHECFELVLVGPDEALSQLQATAKGADHVLAMTSKISHKHTTALRAVGVRPIEFGGGVAAIRDILTKLFVEGQQ